MGPTQEPDNSPGQTFEDWQDYCLPEKSSEFDYTDSTMDHIGNSESEHFKYGRSDQGFSK